MPGLIDLHCHLLPGVDDGALDLEDSVAMARRAQREGIGTVCATPHIRADHDVRIGEIAGRAAALGEELARRLEQFLGRERPRLKALGVSTVPN